MKRIIVRGLCAALPLALCAPALADHAGVGSGLSRSGPVVTIDTGTLPAGTAAGSLSATYTDPHAYSDAELIALAGDHVHAHTTDYNLVTNATLAYGVTGHFTLAARVPYVRRDDLRAGSHSHTGGVATNSVEELGSVSGIGDLTLLGQYLFAHDHHKGWGVAAIGGVKLPTGSTHRRAPDGERLETEHQPGTGSWDPIVGLAASKAWGPVSLHGSALWQISTEGSQETELGNRLNLDTALVYAFGAHGHDGHGGMADHRQGGLAAMIEANYEREGKQRIAGVTEDESGAETIYLSPGLRYIGAGGWSAAVSAGIPVWQDVGPSHPDTALRLIAQVGSRF
jgi:hypothetical protein